jgi:hypothetical protein
MNANRVIAVTANLSCDRSRWIQHRSIMRDSALAERDWRSVDVFESPTQDALFERFQHFCFPQGEDAARRIRAIRMTEAGEIRAAPDARWIAFTARQTIDATQSSFCWEARLVTGKVLPVDVTDAYEQGHGRLTVRVGRIPTQRVAGPDVDKGELQRYLASLVFCPVALVNNPSLEFSEVGPLTLRLRDRNARFASVDLELGTDAQPSGCRAHRPRLVGSGAVLTPWQAVCGDFHERDGLKVPGELEVCWVLPDGPFACYRSRITSFVAIR